MRRLEIVVRDEIRVARSALVAEVATAVADVKSLAGLAARATRWAAAAALAATLAGAGPVAASEPAYRFKAPIAIERPAAFVQLPLPASAYGRSLGSGLQDLRIVDALGQRVPFAVLPARAAESRATELLAEATLYPLPAKASAAGDWASPVEISVQGERISVKRAGQPASLGGAAPSGGWLIDLGERKAGAPPPQSLRLQWSGPAEFSAAFHFDSSDELRQWRRGGAGQVLALRTARGELTQPSLMLPAGVGRFVRLVWADAGGAPAITGAKLVSSQAGKVVLDAPTELLLSATAPPATTDLAGAKPAAATTESAAAATAEGAAAATAEGAEALRHALHYDLGGVLPLTQIDLRLAPGTRVAPVRLQGRERPDQAWRDIGAAVFYRLERGAEISISPALAVNTAVRFVRVLPDARSAALDPGLTQLVLRAPLASLVFVAQGTPPYSLWAGDAQAPPSALPLSSLVPALDDERPRFGRATLGAWIEAPEVALAAQRQAQWVALRPWLLWAVLLVGVAGLGFMVWRLARAQPAAAD